jgi:hypothetical protein
MRQKFMVLALVSSVASLSPGSEECQQLGFNPTLMCPSCDRLADAIGAADDEGLLGECRGCCTEPEVSKKSSHARLEVCK